MLNPVQELRPPEWGRKKPREPGAWVPPHMRRPPALGLDIRLLPGLSRDGKHREPGPRPAPSFAASWALLPASLSPERHPGQASSGAARPPEPAPSPVPW